MFSTSICYVEKKDNIKLMENFIKLRYKILFVIVLIAICCSFVACEDVSLPKTPVVLSQETIYSTAVVKSYNEDHWYSGNAHHYKFSVHIYCEEYNMSKTLTDQANGMWITSDLKGLKKGDVIKIKLIKKTYETHTTITIDSIIK